ncbi:MAG: (d)CMP kinase [Bacteroidales bacterium]|nr:(d)CMP kinase [Bacteroidales bacterium]
MKKIVIAIDGYSSCGKSTLAKEIAKTLSYIYIDTGAMYRAVTCYFMENDLIEKDLSNKELEDILKQIHIRFERKSSDLIETFLNGKSVENKIRSITVSRWVSQVSQIKKVREYLVKMQQEMGKDKCIILDGRDIGTVVFPDAEVKLFLTADAQIRAQRRFDELKPKQSDLKFEEVLENITQRDYQDENRTESPLKKATDAIVIDNSFLSREEQLKKALEIINSKLS